MGNVYQKLRQYEKAIKCYDTAIKHAKKPALKSVIGALPMHVEVIWNSWGDALYNLGRYKEALKCFEKAIKLDKKWKYPL